MRAFRAVGNAKAFRTGNLWTCRQNRPPSWKIGVRWVNSRFPGKKVVVEDGEFTRLTPILLPDIQREGIVVGGLEVQFRPGDFFIDERQCFKDVWRTVLRH